MDICIDSCSGNVIQFYYSMLFRLVIRIFQVMGFPILIMGCILLYGVLNPEADLSVNGFEINNPEMSFQLLSLPITLTITGLLFLAVPQIYFYKLKK